MRQLEEWQHGNWIVDYPVLPALTVNGVLCSGAQVCYSQAESRWQWDENRGWIMNDIRMIALDIDGTILTHEKKLTVRTKKAIDRAIAEQLSVVLVTGRPLHGIPEKLLNIPELRYVITSNGAVTTDLKMQKVLRMATLDAQTAISILTIPRSYDLIYAVFLNGIGYIEMESFMRHMRLVNGTPLEPYIRKSRRIVDDLDTVIQEALDGVENIWFLAHDREERDRLSREIQDGWPVRSVITGRVDVEIGNLQADKGLAVSALADQLGITKEQILAIGDSGNDLGMLQNAGIAVAMGNADEEVMAAADIVTASNEEDGVAVILERLLWK